MKGRYSTSKNESLKVETEYGIFDDIPNTTWQEMQPYWADIVASIIEVLKEDKFNVSSATKDNSIGSLAASAYWKSHEVDLRRYPLKEARRFIEALKEKPRFQKAIRAFNKGHNTDWLLPEKVPTLGGFLHSLCLPMLDYLRDLRLE